ncbi:MAG: hypothetical protein R2761_22850 [Acidimicrobiales bacterium]
MTDVPPPPPPASPDPLPTASAADARARSASLAPGRRSAVLGVELPLAGFPPGTISFDLLPPSQPDLIGVLRLITSR